MRPATVAGSGSDAGRRLLDSISGMWANSVFEKLIQLLVRLFAWVLVLLAVLSWRARLFVLIASS